MRIAEFLNVILIPLLVLIAALGMIIVETRRGGRQWPQVRGWWARALLLNGFQVGAVWIAGMVWNGWMLRHRPWSADALGLAGGSLLGYRQLPSFSTGGIAGATKATSCGGGFTRCITAPSALK